MIGTSTCSVLEDSFLEREDELSVEAEFVPRKRSKNSTYSVKKMTEIYNTLGPLSTEFYEAIHNFLAYLQHRYLASYDEDVQVDCYLRVIKSFEEYDPSRSNLATWIHTIIRYHLSNVRYAINKRTFREGTSLQEVIEVKEGGSFDHAGIRERDRLTTCISNFSRMSVALSKDLPDAVSSHVDHPLNIRALWEEKDCLPEENQQLRMKKPGITIMWSLPVR